MPQFLVASADLRGDAWRLSGSEAFHIVKVLRYASGRSLTLFDGNGRRFTGVIEDISPDGTVSGRITAHLPPAERALPRLTLYLGLLKAGSWDYALEKGTELGVSSFVPVLTSRTVVLLHGVERVKSKQERWARLVMAAAKQCGRADLPLVRAPLEFRDAIRAPQDKDLILLAAVGRVPTACGGGPLSNGFGGGISSPYGSVTLPSPYGSVAADTLGPALRSAGRGGVPLDVSLFVGPEGGFSAEEVELAHAAGAVVFGMGPRVLRAETAAVAALALVQYELGRL